MLYLVLESIEERKQILPKMISHVSFTFENLKENKI